MTFFLTEDEILAPRALPRREVPVPEWATAQKPKPVVLIQGLSSGDGDKFLASLQRVSGQKVERDTTYYSAKLLQLCLVNEKGERIVSEGNMLRLAQQDNAVIMRLAAIAQELSGFAPNSVEDAAKN
jgi:hypothetical protein